MHNKEYESIIGSLFAIIPLLKRDLIKPELNNEAYNLSSSHFHILFMLEDLGVQSMSDIGKHMQINKSNLTPLVQKLIDHQLVERIADEKDRRYIRIGLTAMGIKLLEVYKVKMAEHLMKKLSILKPEELQKLADSLTNVKELMLKLYE